MRCYYHRDREAVGLCKSCGKGLCEDCQADLGRGLACKGRCEDDVNELISLTQYYLRSAPAAKAMSRWNRPVCVCVGLFLFVPGAFMMGTGMRDERFSHGIPIGAILVAFGLMTFIFAWKLPQPPEGPSDGEGGSVSQDLGRARD
jgi:hypothetical protein